MATNADCLKPMAQGTKKRYSPQQSHEAVRDRAAPYHDNVMDSKTAAEKFEGVVITDFSTKSKVSGMFIDSNTAAEKYNGVVITENKESKVSGTKNRHSPQQPLGAVRDRAAPYHNNVSDSNRVAEKQPVVVFMKTCKGKLSREEF